MVSSGFPPKDGSVRSPVADPIEAFGNDRLIDTLVLEGETL